MDPVVLLAVNGKKVPALPSLCLQVLSDDAQHGHQGGLLLFGQGVTNILRNIFVTP